MTEAPTQGERSATRSVAEAARSIGVAAWVIAAIAIPLALILRAYGTVLLVVILVVFWQFLAAVLTAVAAPRDTRTHTRYRARLTSWGLVYCGICALFLFVAMHWGINLLFLTSSFLIGAGLCAVAYPWLMLTRLTVGWSVPERLFAGEQFAVDVELRNDKRVLSAFGLRVGAVSDGTEGWAGTEMVYRLPPGRLHDARVRQFVPERGLRRLQPTEITTAFPFGIIEVTKRARYERELLFLPHMGHLEPDALRRYAGGEARWLQDLRRIDQEGEFRSLREYRPGDNPRRIHWPTSARLRKLFVKEFERREMHSVLVLLDSFRPAGPDGESAGLKERYERAVSFVATLALLLNQRQIYYAFASFCPDLVALPYDTGLGHFYNVLETLAVADQTSEHSLSHLARALSYHEVSTGGICLVSPGPLPPQAVASVASVGHGCVAVDVCRPEFDEIYSH